MRRRRFLDIAIPERFVLEFLTDTGEWLDHGLMTQTASSAGMMAPTPAWATGHRST